MYRAEIAKVAYEVNREYRMVTGEAPQPLWEQQSDEYRAGVEQGVSCFIDNPDTSVQESHQRWVSYKERTGWVYGPVQDDVAKEHPCMVPYEELPVEQRAKDYIFRGVVKALRSHLNGA